MIKIIVACDEKNVIGKNNQLIWHLPADLKHFKNLTTGHSIIMGRKTFDSIGKALPNRNNLVVSRQKAIHSEGIILCHSLEEVSDAQLEEYLAKHKDRFKGVNSRSIQYATFPVVPTAQDTVEFYNQIKKLLR